MSIFSDWVLLKLRLLQQLKRAPLKIVGQSYRRGLRLRLLKEQSPFFSAFCACACYGHVVARTCTCFCGVLPQHIPVGCEHFVVVGLTRIEVDTMTPRDYKSRKSTRLGSERVLSLHLRC